MNSKCTLTIVLVAALLILSIESMAAAQACPPPTPPLEPFDGQNPITLEYRGALDVVFHDFDADGYLDLFYHSSQVGQGQLRSRVYRNNLANRPPSARDAFVDITGQVFPPAVFPPALLGAAYENKFLDGDLDYCETNFARDAFQRIFLSDVADRFVRP